MLSWESEQWWRASASSGPLGDSGSTGWLVDRYVRPLQVRRYLVEMAHYGNYNDARQSAPSMRELRLYGNALKRGYEQAADEADEDYAKRVWHVNNIRND